MSIRTVTIHRSSPDGEPMFSVDRAMAQDKRLSYTARGIMVYILSAPDSSVTVSDLVVRGRISWDEAELAIGELRRYGYVTKETEE